MARVVVSEELIRHCADGRSFDRGKAYFAQGVVRRMAVDGTSVTATVDGTRPYRVRLRVTAAGLEGECSCPYGADGMFCKHCVAAGLAWLASEEPTPAPAGVPAKVTDAALRDFLHRQDTRWLAAELLRVARADPLLRARLEVAAGADPRHAFDDRVLRRRLEDAIELDEHVPYGGLGRIEDVLGEVAELIGEGFADQAVTLAEYAMGLIEDAAGYVDDSDGELGDALAAAERVHLDACRAGRPDPEALADRLVDTALASEYEVFLDAMPDYAEVLGEAGMARYRQRVEAAWQALPPKRPGRYDSNRFTVTHLMERLAACEGGTDALVEVLARDAGSAYDMLRVAQTLAADARPEEALHWIRRGLDDTGDDDWPGGRHGEGLRALGAECLLRLGRRAEAAELLWANFEAAPTLTAYQALRAATAEDSTMWRDRALDLLTDRPAAEARDGVGRPRGAGPSALVEILLWEGDADGAWQAARQGDCRQDLLLRVARARAATHPADALPVLWQVAERLIEQRNRSAYREAAGLLAESESVAGRCGRTDDFQAHLTTLRAAHRAKRALRDELDRARLPGG
ncbi:SWIM zinc finger family protein [Nonomuraea muscovyensis]|uniref:Putative Zn finger protein n=1 Tax=Nonomuraea muscovyensis TaxID=1124761 RepID=A0A7X0F0R0_9ACTN|nr:DUF6880 family protein [Nonomuraea muscovyensis]MBB6348799.1 putative Zn finger protein [Nonomuraea muscovyensis]